MESLMFLKEVSNAHQSCINMIKNTVKAVILWNITAIKNNEFTPVVSHIIFPKSVQYAALLDTEELVEFDGHHRIVVYYLS